MNETNNKVASNIKVLREEARLSLEEFAEKAGVSVNVVKAWEAGTLKPYTKDLMVICPILKIHEEDLLERDIASERLLANKKMKHSQFRSNYNWYYGSRSKFVFYLLAVILIPSLFLISFFSLKANYDIKLMLELFTYPTEEIVNFIINESTTICLACAYVVAGTCGAVFMIIEIIKRFRQYFRFWYIFLIISFSSLIYSLFLIALIPYYIYCLYQLIVKHGKN